MRSEASRAADAVAPQGQQQHWRFRDFQPDDLSDIRSLHMLLPVRYDIAFFQKACEPSSPILTWLAHPASDGACRQEQTAPAGLATACVSLVSSLNYNDRRALQAFLGLQPEQSGATRVLYILTLAVSPAFQRQGLARQLLHKVREVRIVEARASACKHAAVSVGVYTCVGSGRDTSLSGAGQRDLRRRPPKRAPAP